VDEIDGGILALNTRVTDMAIKSLINNPINFHVLHGSAAIIAGKHHVMKQARLIIIIHLSSRFHDEKRHSYYDLSICYYRC
jgi:hypothetical protein